MSFRITDGTTKRSERPLPGFFLYKTPLWMERLGNVAPLPLQHRDGSWTY